MRNAFLLSFFFLLSLGVAVPTATAAVHPAKAEIAEPAAETALSKQELRQQKRELRKQERQERKANRAALKTLLKQNADTDLLLIILVTIFIPPLGMFLYEGGITNRFWISLVLTLLFFLPGLIYTLIVVLS